MYIYIYVYVHVYVYVYANGCKTVRVVTHIFNFKRTFTSPPHPTPPHAQCSISGVFNFNRTLTSPPHPQRSINGVFNFKRTLTSPPHSTPPHAQRSINGVFNFNPTLTSPPRGGDVNVRLKLNTLLMHRSTCTMITETGKAKKGPDFVWKGCQTQEK